MRHPERDVTRFTGEPEALFRLRVKFAFINSVDAGSTAGMKRIFERLGVGYVEIEERQPGRDWDVVLLKFSNAQLSSEPPSGLPGRNMVQRRTRRDERLAPHAQLKVFEDLAEVRRGP